MNLLDHVYIRMHRKNGQFASLKSSSGSSSCDSAKSSLEGDGTQHSLTMWVNIFSHF